MHITHKIYMHMLSPLLKSEGEKKMVVNSKKESSILKKKKVSNYTGYYSRLSYHPMMDLGAQDLEALPAR